MKNLSPQSSHSMLLSSFPCDEFFSIFQTFTSTSELAIHEQKHQMTLKLGPARGLTDMLPFGKCRPT